MSKAAFLRNAGSILVCISPYKKNVHSVLSDISYISSILTTLIRSLMLEHKNKSDK